MVTINSRQAEVEHKLILMRQSLEETGAIALHLTGTDWFAWATAGASNTVLLLAETGVAEILVTIDRAWILTDQIEAQRLLEEELTGACHFCCPHPKSLSLGRGTLNLAPSSLGRRAGDEGKIGKLQK